MFERFTDRTRDVMALANREAIDRNHPSVGTEHVLLALVNFKREGVGAHVLKTIVGDLSNVRTELEKSMTPGGQKIEMEKLPLSSEAKNLITDAEEEARSMDHNYVGTEHILLGFLHQPGSIAADVLTNLGISQDQLRKGVRDMLGASRYEISICRAGGVISLREWQAAVAATRGVRLRSGNVSITNPKTGEVISIPNSDADAELFLAERDRWVPAFRWCPSTGEIVFALTHEFSKPDSALAKTARQLALHLGAQLIGERREIYK